MVFFLTRPKSGKSSGPVMTTLARGYSPSRHFDFALDGDTVFGSDVDILVLQGPANWRPAL